MPEISGAECPTVEDQYSPGEDEHMISASSFRVLGNVAIINGLRRFAAPEILRAGDRLRFFP
jgi:hypothetical protein